MNIWQYFDNRSKRSYVMKQLKFYRKDRNEYDLIWNELPKQLMQSHLVLVSRIDEKIKYYEEKLNDLL